MEQVRQHFLAQLRQGRLLSREELVQYSKKNRLGIPVSNLRDFRKNVLPTAVRRASYGVKHHMSFQVA